MKRKQWMANAVAGAAVWATLAGAAAANPTAARTAPPLAGKPAATVNGEVITFAQLEPVLKLAGPLPVEIPEAQRRELQREALSMLIDDLLLQQFLRKHVPAADPAEVNKKMAELEAGLKQKKQTLAEFCRESHQTEAQLRTNIAHFLQWSAYARQRVGDAELQRYFTGYRDFFDRVTVRASHIVVRVGAKASPGEVAQARAKLAELRKQILAGKFDFAQAAKDHSQCPSAQTGGDIGSFPRKFVVEENFARVAFGMKPGEVSDVVQTDFGLHLIKVTERKAGQPADFNKVKEEVKEFYLEDLRQTLLAQLRKEAKIEIHLP